MKKIILAAILSLTIVNNAFAGAVEVEEVYIDYKSFFDGARDPLITQNGLNQKLSSEFDLHLNMTLIDYVYWDNMIHSLSDQDQFRLIGWNYRVGVRLSDFLEVGYEHFSQHFLDYQSVNGFPMYDAIQVKFFLYRRKSPGKGLFF